MSVTRFYSPGKLLITAEYLVLDGAWALALPTRLGQSLEVSPIAPKGQLHWQAYTHEGQLWLDVQLSVEALQQGHKPEATDSWTATLTDILHQALQLQPEVAARLDGQSVRTQLEFPQQWGLGSSSTLINNLGQWLDLNPYALLEQSFGGSGYDIACAQAEGPLMYQRHGHQPFVHPIRFAPSFADQLYFVYLNRKQNSKSSVAAYSQRRALAAEWIPKIDRITHHLLEATDAQSFAEQLQAHEQHMSLLLELPTLQETAFADFEGTVKSLGAWGGDFALVVAHSDPTLYFKNKGYDTLIPYTNLIK